MVWSRVARCFWCLDVLAGLFHLIYPDRTQLPDRFYAHRSGVTTLLKTLAGVTRGLQVDSNSIVNYEGLCFDSNPTLERSAHYMSILINSFSRSQASIMTLCAEPFEAKQSIKLKTTCILPCSMSVSRSSSQL